MVWLFICFELPDVEHPGTAHLKRGRKLREQPFYPDPQLRFVVDDAERSFENGSAVSRTKSRRSQFPNNAKGVRGRFQN